MININIICVGNLKEEFWIKACQEYQKRLSRFCKLNIIEVEEENLLSSPQKIVEKEGQSILKKVKGQMTLLAIEGKQLTSEEFSKFLESQKLKSGELNFVIGGSYGVSDQVKSAAAHKISFGKITLPHNLARVVLLEQLYRAFMISSGASYHK